MTYRELINKYSETIRSDYELELEGIEFIIQEITNFSRSELILNLDKNVCNIDLLSEKLDMYCIKKIPAQYVIGYTYFYGLKIYVNKNVLIPRFDTEIVVEKVIEYLQNKKKVLRIIDVGTGSGAVAIALANNNKESVVEAVDISEEALNTTIYNSMKNNVNIRIYKSDLLDEVDGYYDCIISNPPYIDEFDESEGLMNIVRNNEPHLALFSDDHGLAHYKKLIKQSLEHLNDDGVIFLEIPDNKCDEIVKYASDYYKEILIYRDYNNLRRVLRIGVKR
ncbi:MAG: peptide chain release factor N(5)-glutamine methyltransferase [Bacilli bacterium]|nr:peptide chain release factor N(5)-glutamine methyltransferase [Bacilli bacterium]